MTKQELYRIISLNQLIESKLRQLEQLKATYYDLKSIVDDVTGVRGTNISKPTENAAVKLMALSEEINRDIDTLVDLKEKAAAGIQRLDWKYRVIMELRYMECLSWAEIADKLGYCRQHVNRCHGEALKMLQNET